MDSNFDIAWISCGHVLKSLLKEKDVLAVLPTGFGKTLVFQVFAVVRSLLSFESN